MLKAVTPTLMAGFMARSVAWPAAEPYLSVELAGRRGRERDSQRMGGKRRGVGVETFIGGKRGRRDRWRKRKRNTDRLKTRGRKGQSVKDKNKRKESDVRPGCHARQDPNHALSSSPTQSLPSIVAPYKYPSSVRQLGN